MTKTFTLDHIGQPPRFLKFYTPVAFFFPVSDPKSHERIITVLRRGLDTLADNLPWIAGEVVNVGASEGCTGRFVVQPNGTIPLVVKDLTDEMESMGTLREAHFPISMFSEKQVAPVGTLNRPGMEIGLARHSAPVFAVQVNFIKDGCILTIAGQHNVMDMNGEGYVIQLMSKACHNEPFTKEELSVMNMDRSNVIPLLGSSYEPGPELRYQLGISMAGVVSKNPIYAYMSFSAESLAALKAEANKTKDPSCPFVSTDDAVSAFIWQGYTRARQSRLEAGGETTLARTVDARPHFGLPPSYPGMLHNMVYATISYEDVVNKPLGFLASALRARLDPKEVEFNTRALATYTHNLKDKVGIAFAAKFKPASDVTVSSWAKVDVYGLDFNLGLGTPETVGKPLFSLSEGIAFLMPKAPDGSLRAAACLSEADWEHLKKDTYFMSHVKYIG